jgi:hypothetical protein
MIMVYTDVIIFLFLDLITDLTQFDSNENEEDHVWLQSFASPWSEVKRKWDSTMHARMKMTANMELFSIYKLYPCTSNSLFQELVIIVYFIT